MRMENFDITKNEKFYLDDFILRLNELIEAAVIHGGDSGGTYCSDKDGLCAEIIKFISFLGLTNYIGVKVNSYNEVTAYKITEVK